MTKKGIILEMYAVCSITTSDNRFW